MGQRRQNLDFDKSGIIWATSSNFAHCFPISSNWPTQLPPTYLPISEILHSPLRSLNAVGEQFGAAVAVAAQHHCGAAKGRVRVDRVPLDSVADEVVVVRSALVVDAVEMRLKTAAEPPRAAVVLRAVVIETRVVVAATGFEVAFTRFN